MRKYIQFILITFLLTSNFFTRAQNQTWSNARVEEATGKLFENSVSIDDKEVKIKLYVHDPVKERLVAIQKSFDVLDIDYFSEEKKKAIYILKEQKSGVLYTMPLYNIDNIRCKIMVSELISKSSLFKSLAEVQGFLKKEKSRFNKIINVGKIFYQNEFHLKVMKYKKLNKVNSRQLLKWIERKKQFVLEDSDILRKIYYPISTIEREIYQEVLIKNKVNPYMGQFRIQRAFAQNLRNQEVLNMQQEYYKELEKLGLY